MKKMWFGRDKSHKVILIKHISYSNVVPCWPQRPNFQTKQTIGGKPSYIMQCGK